jgi:SAM-dependent methyltransferase
VGFSRSAWLGPDVPSAATRRYDRLVSGDWSEWEWDETLFAGAAAHYDRGRLPNAPGLADALELALGLDGGGRLLDVGCGPGTVTLPLAGRFREVVGLDADAGMIHEAQRLASERGVMNARWVHGRAEDLPAGLGAFNVVTFAASFHWMDRPLVAGIVRTMLEPDGVVVHVDNRHQDRLVHDDALPAPPVERIAELRRAYLGEDRRAGQGIRNSSPGDEAAVLRAAGFAGPELVVVPDDRTIVRSADDLVAETFSLSSTAPHLFGDRRSQFEADLRRLLAESSPDGGFAVQLPDNELKIWRVAAP